MNASDVQRVLAGASYCCTSEAELQRALEQRLTAAGVSFQREVRLSPKDRIDFLVGSVGVEVKFRSSPGVVLRQVHRYVQSDQIQSVVVVSLSRSALVGLPSVLDGKPVLSVLVKTGAL